MSNVDLLKKELDKKINELIEWIVDEAPLLIEEMECVPPTDTCKTRWNGKNISTLKRGFVNADDDKDQFFFAISEKGIMEAVESVRVKNGPKVLPPCSHMNVDESDNPF